MPSQTQPELNNRGAFLLHEVREDGGETPAVQFKGVLVTAEATSEMSAVHTVHLKPSLVMVDTGCRRAVGGTAWHNGQQKELGDMGLSYTKFEQKDYFQVGPGRQYLSTHRRLYPVGVAGWAGTVEISEVSADVPGVIGPGELAKWDTRIDFTEGKFEGKGMRGSLIN